MADIKLNTYNLSSYAQRVTNVNRRISLLDKRLDVLYTRVGLLGLWKLVQADMLTSYSWRLERCASYLQQTAYDFEIAENLILGKNVDRNYNSNNNDNIKDFHSRKEATSKSSVFLEELKANYGWNEILKGSGYIGKIHGFVQDIKNGKTWADFLKSGFDIYDFLNEAAKTYKNYRKIGNAVGQKTAMSWWLKNITGAKPLGRASTAKNIFTRFKNNLTNKTSPFNAQFKNVIKDFKGANGVGKAVSAWGSVALTGVCNWFGNKEEQANSNGTMSTGRVIAETITETAVDTALSYGAGIVVGAAVTTALGTVAAPGVLVVAAGGLVVAGVNAGVKALTGKTATEWVSDAVLDTGKAIGKAVGNGVKTVGKWFKNLF